MDKLLTRTYCDDTEDNAVPNVLSPENEVSRPVLSDKTTESLPSRLLRLSSKRHIFTQLLHFFDTVRVS